MPGLDPGIWCRRMQIAGSSPAMTTSFLNQQHQRTRRQLQRAIGQALGLHLGVGGVDDRFPGVAFAFGEDEGNRPVVGVEEDQDFAPEGRIYARLGIGEAQSDRVGAGIGPMLLSLFAATWVEPGDDEAVAEALAVQDRLLATIPGELPEEIGKRTAIVADLLP